MASVNKCIIIGNLGDNPDTKYMPSGAPVTTVSVATTEKWKDKATGNMQEKTEWHRIKFFNRLAEIVSEYLRKGAQIYVEGRLQTHKWTDKTGVDRYSTEIIGQDMKMLGSPQKNAAPASTPAYSSNKPTQTYQRNARPEPDPGDDIPF